jgi:oligopeptide/dipeptide ABC transporter ATP-binding protein
MKSIPVFGKKKKMLEPIKGMVPSPTDEIKGCAFADRCPKKMEKCEKEEPPFKSVEENHQTACWLY